MNGEVHQILGHCLFPLYPKQIKLYNLLWVPSNYHWYPKSYNHFIFWVEGIILSIIRVGMSINLLSIVLSLRIPVKALPYDIAAV